jgi:iron complex transport system substrate-binding protein
MRPRGTMGQSFRCKLMWALAFSFVLLSYAAPSPAREITNMFGKRMPVPDLPQKVYSTAPPVTYMLYALDPSMLAGLNFPVREWEKRYLRKSMQGLPILGGWFGQGGTPNLEMILKVNPEIVVVVRDKSAMKDKVDRTMKKLPMPAIDVAISDLSDYPGAFLYLGRVLGRETRAELLAACARNTLSDMAILAAAVPVQKRVSVYYAEGVDGLSTECDTSEHAELISRVGGQNVHRCKTGNLMGLEKVTLEQVMLYDPEVILVMEKGFYGTVFSDPRWQRIKAVRDKKVYLIPNQPFNWFDRPPSFMRLLGVKWLAHLLNPERYRVNIVKEVQQFFQLFLDVDLTATEAERLVQGQ